MTGKTPMIARRLAVLLLTLAVLAAAGATTLVLARDRVLASVAGTGSEASATLLAVDGRIWADGVRDPASGGPLDGSERFRIGSVTKTFVATVVLQLVDEGRVALDATIEQYLPGVVRDGALITVRQILQHTSGLPDHMSSPGWSTNRWRGDDRFRDVTPARILQEAFTRAPHFPPGAGFRYSNTNYVVAGLLVEAVTGRPYAAEIEQRILEPLGLTGTSLPGSDPRVPEPAVRAETVLDDGRRVDVTEQNESLDGAAGEMISTHADLATFLDALLGGGLLTPQTLAEMRATVPMGAGFHYGLGLQRFDLPCGGSLWGHGGELLGYVTYAFRRADGRTLTLLRASADDDGFLRFAAVATAAFCLTRT